MRWAVPLFVLALTACDNGGRTISGPRPPTRRPAADGGGLNPDALVTDLGRDHDAGSIDVSVGVDLGFYDGGPGHDAGFTDSGVSFDAKPIFDAQTPVDLGFVVDSRPPPDSGPPPDGGANPTGSMSLAAIRAAIDGPIMHAASGVVVTYLKPEVGADPAGFFLQAERDGPAVFVGIDPASLSPSPVPGQVVTFTATERATQQDKAVITALTGFASTGTQQPSTLVQDVTNVSDLVSALGDYESELINASMTVAGSFGGAGGGHLSARVETPALSGNADLVLRMPATLQEQEGLGFGCELDVRETPLWRFHAVAQISVYRSSELTVRSCPAPRIVDANSQRPTQVAINVDRPIDPNSVSANGSQISFSNGLRATAATVTGSTILVTTTPQAAGTSYVVSLASSIRDRRGQGMNPAFSTTTFTGVATAAVVRINELNANMLQSCDLIELRVIQGGNLNGWSLRHRVSSLITFTNLTVSANDFIVVHTSANSATCNPNGATEESGVLDQPAALYPGNFDTARDFHVSAAGLTRTDNVITLWDNNGNIADAVLLADAPTGSTARDSERGAEPVAAAGEWTMVGGGVPAAGFVDDDFCAHAVLDLDDTSLDPSGTSIQRTDDADTNDKRGWTDANTGTWGRNNLGQSNQ